MVDLFTLLDLVLSIADDEDIRDIHVTMQQYPGDPKKGGDIDEDTH